MKRRQPWIPMWQSIYDLVLPQREAFFDTAPGESTTDFIYDETAVVGVPRLASRLTSGFFPEAGEIFSLDYGLDAPEHLQGYDGMLKLELLTRHDPHRLAELQLRHRDRRGHDRLRHRHHEPGPGARRLSRRGRLQGRADDPHRHPAGRRRHRERLVPVARQAADRGRPPRVRARSAPSPTSSCAT